MKESGPDEIRKLFEAQKAIDRDRAPKLEDVLTGSPRSGWIPQHSWKLAGAVLLVVVIVSTGWLLRPDSPGDQGTDFSHWQSPTQFLLRAGGGSLMGEAPGLGGKGYPTSTLSAFAPSLGGDGIFGEEKRDWKEDR